MCKVTNIIKMTYLTKFFLVASVLSVANCYVGVVEHVDSSVVWERFQNAFGVKRVTETYSSESSLANAIALESENEMEVGCSISYEYGAGIADEYRDNSLVVLKPFYISEEEDTMCFFMAGDTPQITALEFQTKMPAALKVDSSITKAVETLYDLADGEAVNRDNYIAKLRNISDAQDELGDLKLSTSVFNSLDIDSSRPLLKGLLIKAITRLLDYNVTIMDRFSFINPGNRSLLSKSEKRRVGIWMKGREALREAIDFSGDKLEDHCNIRNSVREFIADNRNGDLSELSLLNLIRVQNASLASGCLAFLVSAIAQVPSVQFLSISTDILSFNYRARSIVQSSRVGYQDTYNPYSRSSILGTGQVVAVADTGLDMSSCYFKDDAGNVVPAHYKTPITDKSKRKVIQYSYHQNTDTSDVIRGHGTHVCGTVAGNIANSDLYSNGKMGGIAPGAKLAFFDIGNSKGGLIGVPPNGLYAPGRSAGARIHTNSWGSYYRGDGYYGGEGVDQYLYDHQDTTIFFAAGNGGEFLPDPSISIQASAKNIIVVAAGETTYHSKDIDNIASFSSKGPTYDGRIKPDIAAPGKELESASASGDGSESCQTTEKSGTSMASPAAAGAAALIRQYFMESKYWQRVCRNTYQSCGVFAPSGVLMKALVLHSGTAMDLYNGKVKTDLGNPPDIYQGYGRIKLGSLLPFPNSGYDLYVSDTGSLKQNSVKDYYVHVENTERALKITLAWYDPPNVNGITSKALLHNLDLRLLSPSKKRYYGNKMRDSVNTNEQIDLKEPQTGIWQVSVRSRALPMTGTQKYSLVITCDGYVGSASGTNNIPTDGY